MVSASVRGRSNQRKGGYHERKQGKRLGELTGFKFERNLEQRREADHLGDLLCSDDRWPFVIENKYRSQGNSIPAGAWEQACRTAIKSDRWAKRHLAEWPHSAALSRPSGRYRMRAGWL